MPAIINTLMLYAMVGYLAIILIESKRSRNVASLRVELPLLLIYIAALYIAVGFPTPSGRIAFGGVPPVGMIGLMFASVLLGMLGRYLFDRKQEPIDWLTCIKPLFISPMILLPLIGSAHGSASAEPIQVVSLSILAFQNGFFWDVVLERTKKILERSKTPA